MTQAAKETQTSVGGTDVQVTHDGKEVSIDGDVNKVVLNGIVISIPKDAAFDNSPANDTVIADALPAFVYGQTNAGELTKEGIYIGRLKSEEGTQRDYFAAPTDAQNKNGKKLSLSFNQAAQYAKNLNTLGHSDWGVPTDIYDKDGAPSVLNTMFNNKSTGAFKGTFDETATDWGWYWSSSPNRNSDVYVMVRHFKSGFDEVVDKRDGDPFGDDTGGKFRLRPVRSIAI